MLEPDEQKVVQDIETHGWHGVHVPTDEHGPGFVYSAGLGDTFGAPELIVFGLRHEVMHNMVWQVTHQLKEGRRIEANAEFSELIADFSCVMRPVHPSWNREYFGYALWYYHYRGRLHQFKAFQIFWPGKLDGLFPWDGGADVSVMAAQPLLYFPKAEPGHA
jgi:hypothetical protein